MQGLVQYTNTTITLMVSSLPELMRPGEWFLCLFRPEPRPLLRADLSDDVKDGCGEGMGVGSIERLPGLLVGSTSELLVC